jgi:hypothetical protein
MASALSPNYERELTCGLGGIEFYRLRTVSSKEVQMRS